VKIVARGRFPGPPDSFPARVMAEVTMRPVRDLLIVKDCLEREGDIPMEGGKEGTGGFRFSRPRRGIKVDRQGDWVKQLTK